MKNCGLGLQCGSAHGKTNGKLITVESRARKTTVWDSNITLLMVKWIGIQSWVAFLAIRIMVLGPPRRRSREFHKFLKVLVSLGEGRQSIVWMGCCFLLDAAYSFDKIWGAFSRCQPIAVVRYWVVVGFVLDHCLQVLVRLGMSDHLRSTPLETSRINRQIGILEGVLGGMATHATLAMRQP